ncbi:MAG: exonuclease domain-containing protein [Saprospiraceae bacterium]|nr:exonuclease domain-containing protein [Saprospiraceae bacterium]
MHYIILDLEATCWNDTIQNREQEIIEIAACRINAYGKIENTFTSLIKPQKYPLLSSYCKQLTGIEQIEVDRAKKFDWVLNEFLNWCEYDEINPLSIFTWGKTDLQLLTQSCDIYQLEMDWLGQYVDMKSIYARMKGLPKLVGLDKALMLENFEFEGNRHRALPDAVNLAKIFVKYLEEFNE